MDKLEAIKTSMYEWWPSIRGSGSTIDFWSHEWSKHGTCAEQLQPLDTQLKFFNGTINLLKNFNPDDSFRKAGIVPSETKGYSHSEIESALGDYYNGKPSFGCNWNGKHQFLATMGFCLNDSLENTDCSSTVQKTATSCRENEDIYIQAYQ
jgi:ribonuclease T2